MGKNEIQTLWESNQLAVLQLGNVQEKRTSQVYCKNKKWEVIDKCYLLFEGGIADGTQG